MNADLLHAEFDGFQVTIIVLAVIFSFVKWLWEQWQGNKEAPAPPPPPDEIERQLREAAWRRQTAPAQPPPVQPAPPRPRPPPSQAPAAEPSAWEEIRKAWHELRDAASQQPPTSTRPPPQRQRPPRVVAQVQPAPVIPVPQVVAAAPQASEPAVVVSLASQVPSSPILQSLRDLRQDRVAMRRAIVMTEVLGPPKALQG